MFARLLLCVIVASPVLLLYCSAALLLYSLCFLRFLLLNRVGRFGRGAADLPILSIFVVRRSWAGILAKFFVF
jgi:hypothetical protein